MSATAINWLAAAASASVSLGIVWASMRRTVRALVDGVRVVRQLLELQPRVVELGERLVALVEQQTGHGARLDRLEETVFPLSKENHNAP
ncbi:hypothetical protein ABZ341_41640 [Streptomyces sp. NPDC006173]|uniref:hypothetical protein n=1 Tax=Streptomyces sp. NPDC006173 TaxID=3155349 RepID=UPI0033EF7999